MFRISPVKTSRTGGAPTARSSNDAQEIALPSRLALTYAVPVSKSPEPPMNVGEPALPEIFECASWVDLVRIFKKKLGPIVNGMRANQAFLPPMPDRVY